MRAYWAMFYIDLKLLLRRRTVVFFHYGLPLLTLVTLSELFDAKHDRAMAAYLFAMVSVLGIVGSGFFGAGVRAVQEREANILRRFKAAPIGALPFIAASLLSGLVFFWPAALSVLAVACLRYGMPFPERFAALVLLMSAGLLAFRALGLVVAAVANSVQESQLLLQLGYLPMVFLSGTALPTQMLPGWLLKISPFLPSTHLVAGMQRVFLDPASSAGIAVPTSALMLTAALGTFLSVQLFRWEKDEPIRPAAKLWALAALAPFFLLGAAELFAKP